MILTFTLKSTQLITFKWCIGMSALIGDSL